MPDTGLAWNEEVAGEDPAPVVQCDPRAAPPGNQDHYGRTVSPVAGKTKAPDTKGTGARRPKVRQTLLQDIHLDVDRHCLTLVDRELRQTPVRIDAIAVPPEVVIGIDHKIVVDVFQASR